MNCSLSFGTTVLHVERPFFVRLVRFPATSLLIPRQDATHIYDGLDAFPTHVAHMRLGSFLTEPTPWPLDSSKATINSALYHTALQWLKEDRDHRRELEKQGRKSRGARQNVCSYFISFALSYPLTMLPECSDRFRDILQKVSVGLFISSMLDTDVCFSYDYTH